MSALRKTSNARPITPARTSVARKPPRSARWKQRPRCWTQPHRLPLPGQALHQPLRGPARPLHGPQGPGSRRAGEAGGKVSTHPETGQITTVFDEIPQLPVASFHLRFREGARAPLVTPAACGSYEAISNFNPWSAPAKTTQTANALPVTSGPDHRPCPSGGVPPFNPACSPARSTTPPARYSPFNIPHHPQRLRTGDHPLLDQAAAGHRRQAGRGAPTAPTRRSPRPRRGPVPTAAQKSSPPRAARRLAGRHAPWSARESVRASLYVPGKIYLAGPYNGQRSERGRDHRRQGRPLRPRHRRRPLGAGDQPRDRRSLRRRHRLRPDPPHHPGHPGPPAGTSAPTSIGPISSRTRPTARTHLDGLHGARLRARLRLRRRRRARSRSPRPSRRPTAPPWASNPSSLSR